MGQRFREECEIERYDWLDTDVESSVSVHDKDGKLIDHHVLTASEVGMKTRYKEGYIDALVWVLAWKPDEIDEEETE